MIKEIFPILLENGIFIADILIVLFLFGIFYKKVLRKESSLLNDSLAFIKEYYFILAFLTALTATAGSLFYSEIMGYEVCNLCWFQRIFLYSQVVLFGIVLLYKDRSVIKYSIGLSVIGLLISTFHFFSQTFGVNFCGTTALDCSVREVLAYNYITFPVMGMTIFALIIILGLIKLEKV